MRIRPAAPADAPSMGSVYIAAWRDTYGGILPADYLQGMRIEDAASTLAREITGPGSTAFVAELPTVGVVGFATGGIRNRNDCIYEGEIFTLYVLSPYRGLGAGSGLASGLVEWLNRMGVFSMRIQVLKDNPYRAFYERRNGVLVGCSQIGFAGRQLSICTYGWIDTHLFSEAIPTA